MISMILASALALAAPSDCQFDGETRDWTAYALSAWDRLDREAIHAAEPASPPLILFDESCVYRLSPDPQGGFEAGSRRYNAVAESHSGEIALPDGGAVPATRLSFAAPGPDGDMFFVMALPELWRANTSESRDPDKLAMVVFIHEFAHTQQGEGLGRRIDGLLESGLPEDTDDDSLQKRFAEVEDYRSAVETERDLYYEAAAAPHDEAARTLLAEAAASMAQRRSTHLETVWAEADDVFLTFEGSGNWAAWKWLTDPRGGGLSRQAAIDFVRGSARWWSQDAGLGLMLALDRLLPEWPRRTFGVDAVTADALISEALQPSRSSE